MTQWRPWRHGSVGILLGLSLLLSGCGLVAPLLGRGGSSGSGSAPAPVREGQVVPQGTAAQVGGWSLQVHGAVVRTDLADTPLLLIDYSIRNDMAEPASWSPQVLRAPLAITTTGGEVLNREIYPWATEALIRLVDQTMPAPAAGCGPTGITTAMFTGMDLLSAPPMPPGAVFRGWLPFAFVPGMDAAMLHLTMRLPRTPDSPAGAGVDGVFAVTATPTPPTLAWQAPPPPPEGAETVGGYRVTGATISTATAPGHRRDMGGMANPCLPTRSVTVNLDNVRPESNTPVSLILVDGEGRWHREWYTTDGFAAPRSPTTQTTEFVALQGVTTAPQALLVIPFVVPQAFPSYPGYVRVPLGT